MIVVGSHNIISSLGFGSDANLKNVISGVTGIKQHLNHSLSDSPVQASIIDDSEINSACEKLNGLDGFSKLEKLVILSVNEIIKDIDVSSPQTGLLLSTTKGNIEYLSKNSSDEGARLDFMAQKIARYFGFVSTPHVISNACISGVAAFVVAKRLIDAGFYESIVIVGADVLSKFIVSGFQSFQSLSTEPCKPFDINRNGLSLGEAVASVVLHKVISAKPGDVEIVSGAIQNDANHISGPSRTGEGLYRAIKNTLLNQNKPDFICAHGTATLYNDDMESQAIERAGLSEVPVFGLKGNYGHTLGAAGVLETIISVQLLRKNLILGTKGLDKLGVVASIKVGKENRSTPLTGVLKLMSGFGGCNAAVYLKKYE
ncbi:MAG: hypothetical protein JW717_04035 [Marinilabiliaceae bacterium]|nr:hypothetical protein [Marinilabiliaceae bacterium]